VVFAVREHFSATTRELLTRSLRRQALTDPLTRLTNRRGLTERLAWIDDRQPDDLEPDRRQPWVAAALDVDDFKRVNELLGFDAADAVLANVGRRLAAEAPPPALAGRLGGDEFVVIAPGDLDLGVALGESLRTGLAETLQAHGGGVTSSVSVGVGRLVSRSAEGARPHDPLSALVEADTALRAAKSDPQGRVVVFAGAVAQERARRQRIETRLRALLEHGRMGLAALPVVDLDTGRVTGAEALARWDDPLLGEVHPDEFVPVAEQAQLIQPIGEQLLRRALDEAARVHRDTGDTSFTLGMNVSLAQLRRPDFVPLVRDALVCSGFPPSRLWLDVPESTLLTEDDAVSGSLLDLAHNGVRVVIDDFGTGYLALSCLQWLPVHALKVDRSLTESPDDPRTVAVVEAVIEIAHEIGLPVIMEGISSLALAEHWRRTGADAGQGYALAPPSSWESLGPLMEDGVRLASR
jgi:diguanylate cyclase (GGDEF)-like protein